MDRLHIYIVRTRHTGQFAGAFIVPIEIEASSLEDAARRRFDLLAGTSRKTCCALLVQSDFNSNLYLFEVEIIETPQYKIKAAA